MSGSDNPVFRWSRKPLPSGIVGSQNKFLNLFWPKNPTPDVASVAQW